MAHSQTKLRYRALNGKWLRCLVAGALLMALTPTGGIAQQSPGADNKAATARMFQAIRKNNMAGLRDSFAAGANVFAHDSDDLTPAELAVEKGFFDIAHYVLSVRNQRQARWREDARARAIRQPAIPKPRLEPNPDPQPAPRIALKAQELAPPPPPPLPARSRSRTAAKRPVQTPRRAEVVAPVRPAKTASKPTGRPNPFDPSASPGAFLPSGVAGGAFSQVARAGRQDGQASTGFTPFSPVPTQARRQAPKPAPQLVTSRPTGGLENIFSSDEMSSAIIPSPGGLPAPEIELAALPPETPPPAPPPTPAAALAKKPQPIQAEAPPAKKSFMQRLTTLLDRDVSKGDPAPQPDTPPPPRAEIKAGSDEPAVTTPAEKKTLFSRLVGTFTPNNEAKPETSQPPAKEEAEPVTAQPKANPGPSTESTEKEAPQASEGSSEGKSLFERLITSFKPETGQAEPPKEPEPTQQAPVQQAQTEQTD
ncbi:MAG: hypothetical protein QGF09_12255, partial [Rhodospirillales bacterium]|nr:hypothetical protein [Rhodospirillales bacterium]